MAALAEKLGWPLADGDAARELRRDHPRARPRRPPRGRGEPRRDDHGAEDEDLREPRRCPVHDRVGIPTTLYGRMHSGAYRFPNIHSQVLGVYLEHRHGRRLPRRRPAGSDMVERAVDLVARELDLDPVEVRRKNFIPPDAFPYDPGILKG